MLEKKAPKLLLSLSISVPKKFELRLIKLYGDFLIAANRYPVQWTDQRLLYWSSCVHFETI